MTWNFLDTMILSMNQRGKMDKSPKRPSLAYCLKTWSLMKESSISFFRACTNELSKI